MLSLMRSQSFRYVLLIAVAMIIISFITTFGVFGGSDLSQTISYAAKVNGRIIPQKLFDENRSQQLRIRQQYIPNYDEEAAKRDGLAKNVMDGLIQTELFAQEAEARGIGVSNQKVRETIQRSLFRDDESFSEELYREKLSNRGTTRALFERQIKRELMAQAFSQTLRDNLQVSDSAIKTKYLSDNTWVKLEYVKIDPAFVNIAELSDENIKSWSSAHQEDIKAHYEKHINRYRAEAQVQFDHINIPFSAEQKETSRTIATGMRDKLLAGTDFTSLDTSASSPLEGLPSSGKEWIDSSKLPPLVGRELLRTKKDSVSELIEGETSFTLLVKRDEKMGEVRALAEVESEIAKSLALKEKQIAQAKTIGQGLIAQLKSGTEMTALSIPGFAGTLSFDSSVAKANPNDPELGLSTEIKGDDGYVPGIGFSTEFTKAALALQAGETVNEVFEVGDRFFVARVKERQDADMDGYAAQSKVIREQMIQDRARFAETSLGEILKEKANINSNQALLEL